MLSLILSHLVLTLNSELGAIHFRGEENGVLQKFYHILFGVLSLSLTHTQTYPTQ